MGMMAYNGKLYTGTLPSARVYRLDGADRWTPVGRVLDASDNKYRRAWSMALFQGRLFCGTLPSGRVFSLEAGRCVTDDHALPTGWRRLDAVRRDGRLFLYVDGKQAAESAPFDPADYDLGVSDPFGDIPLRIGFGASDYFHGWMRNLCISPWALSAEELGAVK
ncbi:MAG TPA: hypothetical protein PKL54_15545, partial [Candidatus Hydrogenedentes bacterium]|nr:hypothetical protein [Candidatus Hydrogenedentota bacterium]